MENPAWKLGFAGLALNVSLKNLSPPFRSAVESFVSLFAPIDPLAQSDIEITFDVQGSTPKPIIKNPSFFVGSVLAERSSEGWLLVGDQGFAKIQTASPPHKLHIVLAEEVDAFSLRILSEIALFVLLRYHRRYALHSALIATKEGEGWLFVGPSGSGKTTISLIFELCGFRALTDDAVLLAPEGLAFGHARPFHVDPAFFGFFDALKLPSGFAKTLELWKKQSRPGFQGELDLPIAKPLSQGLPIQALFVLEGFSAQTELAPIPSSIALGALLEASPFCTLESLPGHREQLALLSTLLEERATFSLCLGEDAFKDPMGFFRQIQKRLYPP
ncbi:MAG: hypothetical protein N2515_07110 [Deltaproteobacteria bacterium]|nr:hypothetical protein [Deltaproteobacteria bacterium]